MNNNEIEEITTFLTLKHGSLHMMYTRWLLDEIEVTDIEMQVLIASCNEEYKDMLITRSKCRRVQNGIF